MSRLTRCFRPRRLLPVLLLLVMVPLLYLGATRINLNPQHAPGEIIDRLHGVAVYYNGGVNHSAGRHLSADGYNLGLRWQCVEFVKRYYFERFGHRMPETLGHARSFFADGLADGALNPARGLLQFRNGGQERPQVDDLIVFGPWLFNPYGHVAIIARVGDHDVDIVQQNPGPWGASRETLPLRQQGGGWYLGQERLRGWLRLPPPARMLARQHRPGLTRHAHIPVHLATLARD